jgi:hypothetical protein
MPAMSPARFAFSFLSLCCLVATASCARRAEPPVNPPAAVAPAPPDATTAAAAAPAVPPEPELPPVVRACNQKCSEQANHRQMEGFLRCERDKKNPDCKTKVLTANDSERAACRKDCAGLVP